MNPVMSAGEPQQGAALMPNGSQGKKQIFFQTLRWTSIGWAALAIFLALGYWYYHA